MAGSLTGTLTAGHEYEFYSYALLVSKPVGATGNATARGVVSLEDDVDFDTVVVVAYPGIRYFTGMVQSRFYTGIFGGKQLNDDLFSPTVPILQHL